jgi:hypothetical protein
MPNLHEGKEPEKWEMDGWKRVTQQMTFQEGNEKYIKKGFTGADGPETSSTSYFSYFFSTLHFSPVSSLLFFKTGIQKKVFLLPPSLFDFLTVAKSPRSTSAILERDIEAINNF